MTPHKYTEAQRAFVQANIKGRSRKEMTDLFNREFDLELGLNQITAFIKNNKFASGRVTRFQTGQVSWNKGKKGLQTGGDAGWFKKGERPANYLPVGSERVNTDGYLDVKIADPNVWYAKHRIIWEEANGKVPEGHALLFGDGDRTNVAIDNLILVSRKQLAVLNRKGLVQKDIELTRVGVNIADLYSKISERNTRK